MIPHTYTYNAKRRDHPNMKWENQAQYDERPSYTTSSSQDVSLEDMVKSLATNSLKFQQDLHQLKQETKLFQQEARTGLTNIDKLQNWLENKQT